MDKKTEKHLDKAFDVIQMFIDDPTKFDEFPDGSEFFITSSGDTCRDYGEAAEKVQVHVTKNGTGIHKKVII